VLARLFHLTGKPDWRARADAVLKAFAGQPDQLAGMPTLLAAADLLEEAVTVVIIGPQQAATGLTQAALGAPDPAVVVLRAADTGALPADHPAFGKTARPQESAIPHGATIPHGAVAYVCRRSVCGLPITDPAALSRTLRTRV
jgi:uncharacterized protein YyaL (SSP411 family)